MNYTIVQLCQFRLVPAISRTNQIARDALQPIYILTATLGAGGQMLIRILKATVHATIAVVVDRSITDVILIHHVNHAHDRFRVMCRIAINLYIEDVSTTG